MSGLFVVLTGVALLAWLTAHVTLLVSLARSRPRWRALVALALPPLAPYWGWELGARRTVTVWGATLVVYAVGVAVLLQ